MECFHLAILPICQNLVLPFHFPSSPTSNPAGDPSVPSCRARGQSTSLSFVPLFCGLTCELVQCYSTAVPVRYLLPIRHCMISITQACPPSDFLSVLMANVHRRTGFESWVQVCSPEHFRPVLLFFLTCTKRYFSYVSRSRPLINQEGLETRSEVCSNSADTALP